MREQIKYFEEQKETLEVAIKSFMAENDTLTDENGVPLITWKTQKGSSRIDAKTLRDNEPQIAAAYTIIGDPLRKFLVK